MAAQLAGSYSPAKDGTDPSAVETWSQPLARQGIPKIQHFNRLKLNKSVFQNVYIKKIKETIMRG